MAKGGPSTAQLKREIDQLSKDLYNIDLQTQAIRQGQPSPDQITTFEATKLEIQKQVGAKEVELAKMNVRIRSAKRRRQ